MITREDMSAATDALMEAKTIAVVGLDSRPHRTAYQIASYLKSAGYRVIPVPKQQWADEVLGEKSYRRVQDIPEHVDLVDVFVRSEQTADVIEDAIAAKAGAVWLQVGIFNEEGLEQAKVHGLKVAQDLCTMVEHRGRKMRGSSDAAGAGASRRTDARRPGSTHGRRPARTPSEEKTRHPL